MRDVKCIANFNEGQIFLLKDRKLKYLKILIEKNGFSKKNILNFDLGEFIPSVFLADKLIVGTTNGFLLQLKYENGEFKITNKNKIHEQNISTIAFYKNLIITSSWDNSICFVDLKNLNLKKRILQINSWKMKILTVQFLNMKKEILICSDIFGNLIFFDEYAEIYRYKMHITVIRTLLLIDETIDIKKSFSDEELIKILKEIKILSCSNSGVMLLHNSYRIFKFHHFPSLIFQIFKLNRQYFILSDRNMIYSINSNFENIKYYFTEGETNWVGCVKDNFLIYGSSDGSIGVLNTLNNFLMHNSNSKNKKNDEYLDFLERYIYKNASNKKHVFNVELTGKIYKLEYGENETPEMAARRFLTNNNLDSSYQQEIIEFINKNFKSTNINSLMYKGMRLYTSINIEGIKKLLEDVKGWEFLYEILIRCSRKTRIMNIYDDELIGRVEKILKELFKNGRKENRFAILDIVRYMSLFEGIRLDYFFFFEDKFISRKEELIFIRLLCNLFNLNLVNMEIFIPQVKNLTFLNSSERSEFFTFLSKK